jgi:hypothetical protein
MKAEAMLRTVKTATICVSSSFLAGLWPALEAICDGDVDDERELRRKSWAVVTYATMSK